MAAALALSAKSPQLIGIPSTGGWDALGAKSFGFGVYWINRTGAPVDRLGFKPDGQLKGLGDLAVQLARNA